ncbi:MAG TPA: type II secretion system protein [Marinobacter sp.]|nr:type II secretion system protein [Marinobacter sp.]
MRTANALRSMGFTLVELVMVIVLIGVLSVLGIGLFANRSAFSPVLATQQLASATLLAQQAALAGNAASSVTLIQTADEFQFTVGAGTANARTFTLPRDGTSLTVDGTSLAVALTIAFDGLGAPLAGTNRELVFAGDSTYRTCLSSLGAVYAGGCQP